MILLTSAVLHQMYGKRCDGNPNLKYFAAADFENLNAEPVSFPSLHGETLHGAVYTKEGTGAQTPDTLIVFSHGMFGGHLSYTTEINTFAENGFAVLAYDNTGTFKSEGKSLRGFYQGAADLRAALNFVKSEPRFKGMKIVTVGHSWGGYSVLENLKYNDPEIRATVAFSPPDAGYIAASGMLGEKLSFIAPLLIPGFFLRDGKDALTRASDCIMRNDKTQILILHGAADKMIPPKCSPVANPEVAAKSNVTCKIYEGKRHNVYQSFASESYMNETFAALNRARGEKKTALYKGIDYSLMTEEDSEVMRTVVEFIRAAT